MAKSVFDQFAPPPHWRVFEPLLRELDDDTMRIDTVAFMEKIGPIFLDHANAMVPRVISKPLGGKRIDASVRHHMICLGRSRGGPYGYRIVSTDSSGKIEILDTARLPDESEIFGRQGQIHGALAKLKQRQTDAAADPRDSYTKHGGEHAAMFTNMTLTDARLDAIFDKHRLADRLYRRVRSAAQWQTDMRFIETPDAEDFAGTEDAREQVAAEMMRAVEKIVGDSYADQPRRAYIKNMLIECLRSFDAAMGRAAADMLQGVRKNLDREVMDILAINPSGTTARNYALLTRGKDPETPRLWRETVRACPVILLMRDRRLSTEELHAMARGGYDPDRAVTHYFGVTNPERIAFYKGLTEESIGLHNAERLRQLGGYLEKLDGALPDPACPEDWDNLATLVDAAHGIAATIDRDPLRVLQDLISHDDRGPEATIYRHFSMREGRHFSSIANLRDWKERLVTSVIAPKIVVESQKRGLRIPLHHIFYMVSGGQMEQREMNASMHKRLRRTVDEFNAEQSFMGVIFEGVAASNLLDTAFEFATNRHSWDEKIKDRVLSNRLFEQGNQYAFPFLPEISGIDEFYHVSPIRTMADLLKECADLQDFSLMYLGHRVAKEPLHFISVRSPGARTCAILCIEEPKGPFEPWTVRDAAVANNERRNRFFEDLATAYMTHDDFLRHATPDRLGHARAKLRETLVSRAMDRELMGFKVGNISERREVLEALKSYVKISGGWSIDADGCISAPKINAVTDALLRAVSPFYRAPAVA